MAVSPADFVIVRFATKAYGFMREADCSLVPWLEHHKIKFTYGKKSIYFELPEDLQKYTRITAELMRELNMYGREIRRRMLAMVYTKAYRFHDKLTEDELNILGMSEFHF